MTTRNPGKPFVKTFIIYCVQQLCCEFHARNDQSEFCEHPSAVCLDGGETDGELRRLGFESLSTRGDHVQCR
jgi:hypothetical protein